jgi:hypothetical protein
MKRPIFPLEYCYHIKYMELSEYKPEIYKIIPFYGLVSYIKILLNERKNLWK